MNDYISRQAAIDALYHVDEYNGRSVEAIRKLPSTEPEIIRCKDCVDWGTEDCAMVQTVDYNPDYDWTNPDGYCHMAERKTYG